MPAATTGPSVCKPGWQTDDLDEEWVDASLNNSPHEHTGDTLDHSFVKYNSAPLEENPTSEHANIGQISPPKRGTFQIREDQPAAPIGHLLDGRNKSRHAFKDIFTPLALETMFNPPSPHQSQSEKTGPGPPLETSHSNTSTAYEGEEDMEFTNSRPNSDTEIGDEEQGDVILASDIPNLVGFDGRKPSTSYKFTFSAVQPSRAEVGTPLPTSQPTAPTTDSRLRLFQFQYDTFTREHLSAVVDSIAVHTSDSSRAMSPRGLSKEDQCHDIEYSNMRAPKRLKLTPPDELSAIQPPGQIKTRRDYVGESKYLMKKIKETRSPSMMEIFAEPNSPEINKGTDDKDDNNLGEQNHGECESLLAYVLTDRF